MAEKIYAVTRTRARETWYQLSEEEQKARIEKARKVVADVGGGLRGIAGGCYDSHDPRGRGVEASWNGAPERVRVP